MTDEVSPFYPQFVEDAREHVDDWEAVGRARRVLRRRPPGHLDGRGEPAIDPAMLVEIEADAVVVTDE